MGKVKIKKKSTFIDMTAMSDVTVLLLTFFMLTSTFLQKEPTIVYTPSSVSEEKVPTSNLVTILVSSANKAAKEGEDPLATEGKIFISFAGDQDSTWSTPKVKELILNQAVDIYNEQNKDNKKVTPIKLNEQQVKTFTEINMLGTSFEHLPDLLNLSMTEIDKEQGDLENPFTGIPINGNKDYNGKLNDFQIWCRAIYDVASKIHKDRIDLSDADGKALEDLYNGLMKDGTAIAIKADKDMPYQSVNMVFDNLQTMRLNKFSLMTA
ncbi:MAG: biopolymer transporter ExbD, partial [Muribaculaceae bacterium]|nr:biopolymer transporter ExbD [Muribaculaceae bacterium]